MRGSVKRCRDVVFFITKKGGSRIMSEKQIIQNIQELTDNIEQNIPVVRERLAKVAGREPNNAIVVSAAKYHDALQQLADE